MKSCSTCAYWWPFRARVIFKRHPAPRDEAQRGECRRVPPTTSVMDPRSAIFPPSDRQNWCGEYRKFEEDK